MGYSTDGFPYTFPITWATLVEIHEIGIGYDGVSEAVTLTVAETGTGVDAVLVEDLTNTVYQMTTKCIPKDLLTTKLIPKDLLATKVLPKDLLDTSVKGG